MSGISSHLKRKRKKTQKKGKENISKYKKRAFNLNNTISQTLQENGYCKMYS